MKKAPADELWKEDDILLKEDDICKKEDDLEDDLLEEGPPEEHGTCGKGLKDHKDASQCEDLILHPPRNMVDDRSGQNIPDLTHRNNVLFLPAAGTTTNVVSASHSNSFVQSGRLGKGLEDKLRLHTGINDKESSTARNEKGTGELLLVPGNKDNSMDRNVMIEDAGQLTPSMGHPTHHTAKSTQYPSINTMVLVVPGSDRNDGGGEEHTIPDPDHPPPQPR